MALFEDDVPLFELRIVCTNQGGHGSRELGQVHVTGFDEREWESWREIYQLDTDQPLGAEETARKHYLYDRLSVYRSRLGKGSGPKGWDHRSVQNEATDRRDDVEHLMFRFRCKSCNREVRLTGEHLAAITEHFNRNGLRKFDVSRRDYPEMLLS